MAVSISIKDYPDTTHVNFADDDPIYWFLYHYFEQIYQEVGKMVDLYDNAEFFAEELLAFFLVLERAESDVRSGDDQCNVVVGYRGDDRTPLNMLIEKTNLLECIGSLKQLLNHAYNLGLCVVCFGD